VRLLLAALAALVLAAPALASERHPTLADLEDEVMCVECHTTLDMSSSAFADRERFYIRRWIAQGDTKSEIKAKLVDQFGPAVLAAPPKRGFGLVAWLLPGVGIVAGALALGYGAWLWSRNRADPAVAAVGVGASGPALEPELERRLDEELARFDG
jgi:cytochrome c-type biogenesis protein CcmH